jgi:hypothetical protein
MVPSVLENAVHELLASFPELSESYRHELRSWIEGAPRAYVVFEDIALDRLVSAHGPEDGIYPSAVYAYDAHGNRQTANGTTYTYHGNTLRMATQSGVPFEYDDNGNMTRANARTFTYTPSNMLATTDNPVGSYMYDADNWRVRRTGGGSTVYYIRGAGNQLLTEWTNPGSSGSTFRDYIYAGTRLIAVAKQ